MYGCCRWSWRVQRGATSLAYWGIFSGTEYCGSENSLISYGIFRWQISARLQAFPLPISSALVFSVAAPSALRIGLASPATSVPPIWTAVCGTGNRSNPCSHGNRRSCQSCAPQTLIAASHRLSVLPCHCRGNSRYGSRQPICLPPLRDWKRSSR